MPGIRLALALAALAPPTARADAFPEPSELRTLNAQRLTSNEISFRLQRWPLEVLSSPEPAVRNWELGDGSPEFVFLAGAPLRAPGPGTARDPLDYMIVVTGGELLRGLYPDGHTQFITRALRPLGCRCVGSLSVDDRVEDLRVALEFARARAPLVLVTGGLGPTDDDITRETVAGFTGISLREDPNLAASLARRLGLPLERLPENLRRQTRVPARGGFLPNPKGTAVGLLFEGETIAVIALPGPPGELRPMVTAELVPYLTARYGLRPMGRSRQFRFVGIGESGIDQILKDAVKLPPEVFVSSLFEGGRVDLTLMLPVETPDAGAHLDALGDRIRQQLGDYLYAEDGSSLETVIGRLLDARAASLNLLEVGTGGALAAALTSAPVMAARFRGAIVAGSELELARQLGLGPEVSPDAGSGGEWVRRFAETARGEADVWTVAVGEFGLEQAGPGVWVAVRGPGEIRVLRHLRGSSADAAGRDRLVTRILDLMWRQLRAPAGGGD